ncbi:class I SAM-dependent methyltransferase [Rhodoferax sp.]|uniref:class I SAM-dependent methyltransferase n=1 Tax=Rhodoferax sp. TaxID=50421 RepID=UPI002ACE3E79|nr:class I SAM-dependent methyltransferase [Rhodoferax sp.]MDZ7920805.1 class I SAM-dependent methyltransferase [Rhodoferax sp.]
MPAASSLVTPFGSDNTATAGAPALRWTDGETPCSALWRSERGAAPPKRVVLADDTITADAAYRLACEGTALLWRGDFQNARQLLQALVRRVAQPAKRTQRKQSAKVSMAAEGTSAKPVESVFNLHRQAQAQRARVLGMVLIPIHADLSIPLRRAPDARQAFTEAWGIANNNDTAGASVVSLRELLGLISAHEWRKKGVEIAALGAAPNNRIHPHYGVFSPVRGEYVDLVASALKTTPSTALAFDIGTGTGVLAALMARKGVTRVVATDQDPRALACAQDNLNRLGVSAQVQVVQANLFPEGRAPLIVCNPPWLPARPSSPIEYAVYDEGSRMLLGFLNGLHVHLAPGGEGWLIMSDLAEHLGLRSRGELLAAIENAGLVVLGRLDAKPLHPKAQDASDPLHKARAAEVTSLWRLAAKVD